MAIYSTAADLRAALGEVKPSKIAVAFIGIGWERFLLPNGLEEIILSPTIGSNPIAIQQVIARLGIDNVHFLDNLHAKIYIGANSALLGSCNFSRNGFSDNGNFEVGSIFSEEGDLQQLNRIFDGYIAEANRQYETENSKRERLNELYRQWQVSKESRTDSPLVNNGEDVAPSILDWVPNNLERIHITGWSSYNTYNNEVIQAALPDVDNPDDYFADERSLLEDDEIEEGDWILSYRCRNDGNPYKNARIDWIYIHHVISEGAECEDDDRYTKLVGQATNRNCPPQPFQLNDQTQTLIRNALGLPQFRAFHTEELLANNFELVPQFLEHLRIEAANI